VVRLILLRLDETPSAVSVTDDYVIHPQRIPITRQRDGVHTDRVDLIVQKELRDPVRRDTDLVLVATVRTSCGYAHALVRSETRTIRIGSLLAAVCASDNAIHNSPTSK
jgi:Tfp pilus assembly ATPase PilU